MFEYQVIKLGSSSEKNTAMLNKKAGEGWELVSTSPVSRLATNSGVMVTDIQAFLRRDANKDGKSANLITG